MISVNCRLCGAELHCKADLILDEYVWVGTDERTVGTDADLAQLYDPASNPLGACNPYDALKRMAGVMDRAQDARKACLTPLFWQVAREYSALKVRLETGMSFHVHRPDKTPEYDGIPPYHCAWPMWLRPSGWHCRQCPYKTAR